MTIFLNKSARLEMESINKIIKSASGPVSFALSYGERGDAEAYRDEAIQDVVFRMERLFDNDNLTSQEKLILASDSYYLEGNFCCLADENTTEKLMSLFLAELLKTKEPLPKTVINVLKNKVFLNKLTSDSLVFQYIDLLKKLPIHISLTILDDNVVQKLSQYEAINQAEFRDKMFGLIDALKFKADNHSQRYKINLVRIKEGASAPPMPDDMLPIAEPTQSETFPLAHAVAMAINTQHALGLGFQRPDLPEHLVGYIEETIHHYNHLELSSHSSFMDNIKVIFLWIFCRQESANKASFLENLMTDINKNTDKSYTECVDNALANLNNSQQDWKRDSRINKIVDNLRSLDVPVAIVQNEILADDVDIFNKSDWTDSPAAVYAPRQGI
jgi:hypothetical protein